MNKTYRKALQFCKASLLCGGAVLCSLSVNAQNAPAPIELSLPSVILFALDNNPDIEITKEQENQAAFDVDSAKASYYPLVDFTARYGHQYNDIASGLTKSNANDSYQYGISARQILYDGGARNAGLKQTRQNVTSSKIRTALETQDVISDAIQQYINIALAQTNIIDSNNFLIKIREIVADIELMEEAGAASKARVDYAKSRLSFAENQLTDITSSLNDAISNLEFLTGALPEFYTSLPADIDTSLDTLDTYINYGETNNKDLMLNASDQFSLKHSLRGTQAEFAPIIAANLTADQSYDDGGPSGHDRNFAGFADLTWRLFDGWSRDASVNRIKSQINEFDIRDEQITKELTRDIKLFYNQLRSIRQSINTINEEIKSNRSLQALNIENFELGNIDIIELIEGEERLNSSILRRNGEISDLYLNFYQLLIAIGYLEKSHFCETC